MSADLYLIVGLGNPGPKYAATRHNVGWHVLDVLAARHSLTFSKAEKKALTAAGQIAGRRALLAKPQTFMNLSGEAVRGLVDFYKVDLARLLLIADDLDIPLGTLRLRPSGGAGGQKGLASAIQERDAPVPCAVGQALSLCRCVRCCRRVIGARAAKVGIRGDLQPITWRGQPWLYGGG